MRTHHTLKKTCNGLRGKDMGAQTPAAGSNAAQFRPTEPHCPLPTVMDVDDVPAGIDAAGPGWHVEMRGVEDVLQEDHSRHDRGCMDRDDRQPSTGRATALVERDIPEQLAHVLAEMIPGMAGAELGEAFQCAAELPPVTKQSLSELDIGNIITNIKLRHDINFDRDLSFRPNMDGCKGQQKQRQAQRYSKALVAELELYARLFQGTPSLWESGHVRRSVIAQHVERRIPLMFETIHDVLKSLVPDRDHARVDERLDVTMLMQEIERGVCDLVKLAEWMACLLKEHCAPMRDVMVNRMVDTIRTGATSMSSDWIVSGLQELLGILEAMKLDVANHQIRNLRAPLIEDTVNFESHYHLDRLVKKKSKVDRAAAQKWWASAASQFKSQCATAPRSSSRVELEVFIRAVVATLFTRGGHCDVPDTFYLDQDRLRILKSEIEGLVHFDICLDMFGQLLQEFGYNGPVTSDARQRLRTALTAIVGEGGHHVTQSWIHHAEDLSLEILRQASLLAGRSPFHSLDFLQKAKHYLHDLFDTAYAAHASALKSTLLPQILACANKHFNSSASELFNTLVLPTPPPAPQISGLLPTAPSNFSTSPYADRLVDLTNRISHILLLHWRIWGPIAYALDEEPTPTQIVSPYPHSQHSSSASPSPQPHSDTAHTPSASCPANTNAGESDPHVVNLGAPPDPHQTSLP